MEFPYSAMIQYSNNAIRSWNLLKYRIKNIGQEFIYRGWLREFENLKIFYNCKKVIDVIIISSLSIVSFSFFIVLSKCFPVWKLFSYWKNSYKILPLNVSTVLNFLLLFWGFVMVSVTPFSLCYNWILRNMLKASFEEYCFYFNI